MNNLNKITDNFFDWKGVMLSAVSWEIWQSILISLIIAFVGGFLAAWGRQMYRDYHERRKKKKGEK